MYLHFVPLGEAWTASRIYFAFVAMSYGTHGFMLGLGLFARWDSLESVARGSGLRTLMTRAGLVGGCTVGIITMPPSNGATTTGLSTIGRDIVVGVVLGLALYDAARYKSSALP